jgi:hypothetical protein
MTAPGQTAGILAVFVGVYLALGTYSYRQLSATWDEPIHLTSGYVALTQGDYRVEPSHPPLLRMWAALPLLVMPDVQPAAAVPDDVAPTQWLSDAYLYAHGFLYRTNDADRLLYASRFMVLLLGALLGVLVYFWAREWLGPTAALAALACFALEPNLLAHSTLVTTDLGISCLMFGATYFAWRTTRAYTWRNVSALTIFCALAAAAKFSAVLLAASLPCLVALAIRARALTLGRAVTVVALPACASLAAIWASYGFRWAPAAAPGWVFDLHRTPLNAQAPLLARLTAWVDAHHLLPNAFTEGLFYSAASLQAMPAFLAGAVSTDGWWYYFPVAFLLKAPVAFVILVGVGVYGCVRRRHEFGLSTAFVLLPAVLFLAVAMSSGVNIGTRHILPIYPPLVLVAAAGVQELLRLPARTGRVAVAAASLALVAEMALVYPHPLTFFNAFVGGAANGHEYLLDSNLSWGQSLKGLKKWMDQTGVEHVNLSYFGQADPQYYGISCTHLPGAPSFAVDAIARPRLPGYVAISETTIHGVYAGPEWRLFYSAFRHLTPAAVIDNAIRVYWVDEWPESMPDAADPAVHRTLADALFFGMRWPSHAARHYREYVQAVDGDAAALTSYGMALAASDQPDSAIGALRRAIDVDGRNAQAQLLLAQLLAAGRDFPAALRHAEHAVALTNGAPAARLLLGRLYAVHGRRSDAIRQLEAVLAVDPMHADAREDLRRLRQPKLRALTGDGR